VVLSFGLWGFGGRPGSGFPSDGIVGCGRYFLSTSEE